MPGPDGPGRVTAPDALGARARVLFLLALDDRDAVDGAAPNTAKFSDAIVCFHAQQAVEKAAKSLLVHLRGGAAQWHSISDLMAELRAAGSAVPKELVLVARLDRCAVKFRYESPPEGSIGVERDQMLTLVDAFMRWAVDVIEASAPGQPKP